MMINVFGDPSGKHETPPTVGEPHLGGPAQSAGGAEPRAERL
jgi:hypothetical protein